MKHAVTLITGLLAVGAAQAGVYIESVDRDVRTNKIEPSQKMYVQNGSGRFVDPTGATALIKGDVLYILNDAEKSYTVLDKPTIDALAKKINAQFDQVKEQLARLPPEERAQVEAVMAKQVPALAGKLNYTIDAKDTGKSDTVEGRACKVWNVTRNGELDEQMCVASFNQLPGKEDLQAVFKRFAAVYEEIAKSSQILDGAMMNEFNALTKINGYPLRSRDYDNGKLGDTERLVKVWREESFPASMFEVPAGYRKETNPLGLR
jgi:hypothetical protein